MKKILTFLLALVPLAVYGQLYVGANYHPHDDKDLTKIENDIRLMKEAGFTCVRLGHLAWDSYEPPTTKIWPPNLIFFHFFNICLKFI